MKRLLIFVDFFLPGYKAGGITRFIANLCNGIKSDFELYIVTSDRDFGDSIPYPDIKSNVWNEFDGMRIFYLSRDQITYNRIKLLLKEVHPDFVYINSMYSTGFAIFPLIASVNNKLKYKVVLAPNGMLHKGALKHKSFKKRIFLRVFRLLRFDRKVLFHASEPMEFQNIRLLFGNDVAVKLVNSFPSMSNAALTQIPKKSGELKCLFVSRILPLKNLLYLLNVLKNINYNILLTIVGPVENEDYWTLCQKCISTLPSNINVTYRGPVVHSRLNEIYKDHHLFILPTDSENFGQVIFDALLYGRPILISDQTPWKNLEQKEVGWDLPLTEPVLFEKAINEAASWDQNEFDERCKFAWEYAQNYIKSLNLRKEYIDLFS